MIQPSELRQTGPADAYKLGPKPVVGIVGAIGGGKSVLAQAFAEQGAVLFDADRFGHEVLTLPEVQRELVDAFGSDIVVSGAVDRARLADIVFNDPNARARLESISHPRIGLLFRDRLERAMSDPAVPMIVLDAAVLMEAGWDAVCDKIIFVDAPAAARLERVRRHRHWDEAELARREAAQLPNEIKKKRADVVWENIGTLDACRRQAKEWFDAWTNRDRSPGDAGASPKSKQES